MAGAAGQITLFLSFGVFCLLSGNGTQIQTSLEVSNKLFNIFKECNGVTHILWKRVLIVPCPKPEMEPCTCTLAPFVIIYVLQYVSTLMFGLWG